MSEFTRRKFLGAAAVAGAVVAGGGDLIGQVASIRLDDKGMDSLSRLGWDTFLPYVGTDFTFGEGGNAVTLRLEDIKDLRPVGSKARKLHQESFRLKFTGPSRQPLKQNTYRVNHFNIGDFDLFITDGAKEDRLNVYYAVINRVVVPEDE